MSTFLTANDVKEFSERFKNELDREVNETGIRYDGAILEFYVKFENGDFDDWCVSATTESSLTSSIKEKYNKELEAYKESEDDED